MAAECPCGSGSSYKQCCRPYHKGNKHPKTAEALMRARYSAYAKGLSDFILETWHPSTRPMKMPLDDSTRWTGLEVRSTHLGADRDMLGYVDFTARYVSKGIPGALTESSEFIKEGNRWYYLKGNK